MDEATSVCPGPAQRNSAQPTDFWYPTGLFTVLMCADCQAARGHGSGPYPVMTRAEMRVGLNLMPT